MIINTSSRRLFCAAASAAHGRSLRPALHVKYFSATPSESSSKLPSAAAVSVACTLILLSDPISSAISDEKDDGVNNSYWAKELQQEVGIQKQSVAAVSFIGSRLRNEHKFHGNDFNALPSQARIVIVGGGFAGLHTALALAEKMSSLENGTNVDDDSRATLPPRTQSKQMQDAYNQVQPRWSFKHWYGWFNRLFNSNPFCSIDNPSRDNNFSTEIIVLEANKIGTGSSGRAKGLVVPGFQVPLEDLEEGAIDNDNEDIHWTVPYLVNRLNNSDHPRYTKEIAQKLYNMSYIAMDRLKSIVDMYEIDCDWVESGAVEGSIHPMEDDDDEEEEESDGCRILTGDEVNDLMGRTSSHDISNSEKDVYNLYQWGEYDPGCAGVNPLKLTIGLADAVERWGVRIYEGTKLMKLTKTNDTAKESSKESNRKYTLTTEGGNIIRCDHVVLCTGAHTLSSDISRRIEHSFVPIYTWMAATEPLHDQCPLQDRIDGETKNRAPMCGDDHISLNYWRNNNKDDRRLLFGSLADTFVLPEWLISWRLRSALKEIYPKLERVRFDHVWGGKLAFAPNSMPVIGRDTDYDDHASEDVIHSSKNASSGVWYATGFAGHGIIPTTLAGSVLANAILEVPGQQQWKLFQTYFPPSSFNGYPYSQLGAGVVLSIYNIWDWAGKKGIPLPALPKLW